MKEEEIKNTIAKVLGIRVDQLDDFDDPDYGLEIKVYPNNQPSQVLKYISISEMIDNLKEK
jgi:hypothetical protein